VLKYFESFDLAAIARTRDGRLVATRNPAGHSEAWWGRATDLGPVLERARGDSGDVPRAAARLGVRLVEHSAALQRTEQLVAKLDARMAQAQQAGDPSPFNRAYKAYRLNRTATGQVPMNYATAKSRLRQWLADVAAGKASPGIIKRVFSEGGGG
jgi:hypothetical protein